MNIHRIRDFSAGSWWQVAVFVAVVSNLPDIDVAIGLVFQGNGWAFHHGLTHSLVFALFLAFLASNAYKVWSRVPRMSVGTCLLLIVSHGLADFCLGESSVSLFWPFELNAAAGFEVSHAASYTGYIGWQGVIDSLFLEALEDAGIVVVCGLVVILTRLIRGYQDTFRSIAKALFPSA
jgi:hypothetical protein